VNGKKDAIREIEVDQVYNFGEISNTKERPRHEFLPLENHDAGLLESGTMSVGSLPSISDMEFESDFTIRTIPLQFEDDGLHSGMQYSPAPAARADTACNNFSISPASFGSSITRSKSKKARRRFSVNSEILGLPGTISDGHIHSGMQYSPAPAARADTACNNFSISPASFGSSITRSKSKKARRRFSATPEILGLPGTISDGHIQVEYMRFEVETFFHLLAYAIIFRLCVYMLYYCLSQLLKLFLYQFAAYSVISFILSF
jgi:hypothetical protein